MTYTVSSGTLNSSIPYHTRAPFGLSSLWLTLWHLPLLFTTLLQLIATSSPCTQLCKPQPLWLHWKRWVSLPVQRRLASQIVPVPRYLFPRLRPTYLPQRQFLTMNCYTKAVTRSIWSNPIARCYVQHRSSLKLYKVWQKNPPVILLSELNNICY